MEIGRSRLPHQRDICTVLRFTIGLFNATYYWADMDSLKIFSGNTDHLEAKRDYKLWYKGFHIVVSEVLRAYGDGSLEHITASAAHPAATHSTP